VTTIQTLRTLGLLSAAAVVLLRLAACARNSSSTPPVAGSSAASTSASPASARPGSGAARSGATSSGSAPRVARFDGITFLATEVIGTHTIVPGSTITLVFASGSLSANAGCNYLSGPYTVTESVLSVPELTTTAMGCADGLMAQDDWLAGFLASAPTWADDGGTFTLTNGTDTIVMSRAPSGAEALQATGWNLVLLISPGNYQPIGEQVSAWVRFDGRAVAFDTSCNRGGGSAEVTGDTITFGALRSTAITCDGASGETDAAMNSVMVGTTTYRLESLNSALTITSQDGVTALQFSADPAAGADAFSDPSGSTSSCWHSVTNELTDPPAAKPVNHPDRTIPSHR